MMEIVGGLKLFRIFTPGSLGLLGIYSKYINYINSFSLTFSSSPVVDLIYWKDTERTGMVLTGLVVGLLSLFQLSIITVVSTVSLAIVCCTISVRIYYGIIHALKWGDGEHPFK